MSSWLRLAFLLIFLFHVGCSARSPVEDTSELVGRPGGDEAGEERVSGALWYRISLVENSLDIRVRLFNPLSTTRFFFPRSWGGQDDFADHIRISGAESAEGPRFMTIDRSAGHVDVSSHEGDPWIELHYRVDIAAGEPTSPLHPHYSDGVLVAYAPSFIVTPSLQILAKTRDIPILVHLPAEWTSLATWRLDGSIPSSANPSNVVHRFQAKDEHALRGAFLIAGRDLETKTMGTDASRIDVGFRPNFSGDRDAITRLIALYVNHYRSVYGGLGPIRVYVESSDDGDNELRGLGRRGGFVLNLPLERTISPATALLVAHEAFHLWNGHELLPQPASEKSTRWFKEGVTHWVAIQTACLSPRYRLKDALQELARVVASYESNPIFKGGTVRDLDRLRFPYDHGVLFALGIELVNPGDATTIQRWLKALLQMKRRGEYDKNILVRGLMEASPDKSRALRDFWNRHASMQAIDARGLFETAGLHYLPPDPHRDQRLIPLEGGRQFVELLPACAE